MLVRHALAGIALLALSACAQPRLPIVAPVIPEASLQTVHLITTQTAGNLESVFGSDRDENKRYAEIVVSIPPSHAPGEIEWPQGAADPAKHFTVASAEELPSETALFQSLPRSAETIVFVHGFNTNAAEAVYQMAQMREDFGITAPSITFAWPSAGDIRGYLYDRDSVLFARRDFRSSIQGLTRNQGDLLIVAHSMGALLTMEMLRDLAQRGDRATLNRISGLVFISPDIDPDIFRRQVEEVQTVAALPDPFVIFTADQDRALRISSLFTGGRDRLGTITTAEDVDGLPVTVFDMSQFGERRSLNHQIILESPAAISILRRLTAGDETALALLAPYIVADNSRLRDQAARGR